MTDEQIERLAELIVQKMIVKQEEWERQNGYIYISDGEEITDNDVIMAEIDVLNISKAKCIEEEDYEKASEIQKKINKLRDSIN
jgi:protein-arginine kinase activator protein McsA